MYSLRASTGTHSVCLCVYHQNAKLLVSALRESSLTLNDLMASLVCSPTSAKCMLERCEQCPSSDCLPQLILAACPMINDMETIEYKKWVSASLVDVRVDVDVFQDQLVTAITELTSHHFIAKSQAQYLKERKSSLQQEEIIVLMDFAENFSFVVQDAVQGFHWDTNQATLHPMVVYHKALEAGDSLQCTSYCIISDSMEHSTAAVHLFITKLLEDLRHSLKCTSVSYFTDGAASQYKNK